MAVKDGLDWWREVIAGKKPPVTTTPECGWFVVKMNGTMIPASIYWDAPLIDLETGELLTDEILRCEIGGKECDPEDYWLTLAKRPVDQDEYRYWLGQLMAEVGNEQG